MEKVKTVFEFVGTMILIIVAVVAVLIITIWFCVWWIWDSFLKKYFPQKWEEKTKREDEKLNKWLNKQTKNMGWAYQDLS